MYLIISETLRKYPTVPSLNRVCIKDYKIPNFDFYIKKGMHIIIPILGIQKDPNIYPDPEEFRPSDLTLMKLLRGMHLLIFHLVKVRGNASVCHTIILYNINSQKKVNFNFA